jgi:hypothetical protein
MLAKRMKYRHKNGLKRLPSNDKRPDGMASAPPVRPE